MTAPANQIPGIIPAIWQVEPWPVEQVEIIINWLEIEIENHAELRLPILNEIRGHRNKEVYSYIQDHLDDYRARITQTLYGNMPDYQEGSSNKSSKQLAKSL